MVTLRTSPVNFRPRIRSTASMPGFSGEASAHETRKKTNSKLAARDRIMRCATRRLRRPFRSLRMPRIQPMERGDSERIEITISSRFENIELVQVIAEHLCENAGVDEDGSHWIGMAVREAVANAIKHGNKLDVRKKVYATFELQGSTWRSR